MKYDPDIHHRRSVRLRGFDYSLSGAYFVTICVHGRECLFGDVVDGMMMVNELGRVINDEWNRTPTMRPQVMLDEYVVMPNHFHGIIILNCDTVGANDVRANGVGAYCNTPLHGGPSQIKNKQDTPFRSPSQTIGAIVRGFKSATTIQINRIRDNPGCPVWQRNYYERVIRDERELDIARKYIMENPIKWGLDRENPANAS